MEDSDLSDPEKREILEEFLSEFENLEDLDPEYARIVNDNFWELVY